MITKDGRDVSIERVTAENYIVPKGEERSYHVIQEVTEFDRKTGRRISVPRIQKYGKKVFESIVYPKLKQQGYALTILHDPTKWIKEQQEAAQKAQAEALAKKKAEEEERFRQAVAAEVARQMAAMKAAETEPDKSETETKSEAETKSGKTTKK